MKNIKITTFLLIITCYNLLYSQTVGLISNSNDATPGYTLFAPMNGNNAYLIDNCGRIINSWKATDLASGTSILLEDGSLLYSGKIVNKIFSQAGGTGGSIEKINWKGEITWRYVLTDSLKSMHHDIYAMPNGNVLAMVWVYKNLEEIFDKGRTNKYKDSSMWDERLIEIKPIGKDSAEIVWQWDAWEHTIQDIDSTKPNYGTVSKYPGKINLNYFSKTRAKFQPDWLHCNSIDYNKELDQIMIGIPNFHEFWIIDHSTSTQQAKGEKGGNQGKGGDIIYRWGNPITYNRGSEVNQELFFQHNSQWIPKGLKSEGNFLIFNNGNGRGFTSIDIIKSPVNLQGGYFIDELLPYLPTKSSWSFKDSLYFYSQIIGGVQPLPNGHFLICDGLKGRFFEIDSNGKKVWEYINPVNKNKIMEQGLKPEPNDVLDIQRYPNNYAAFNGKVITPGARIELNPINDNCGFKTVKDEDENDNKFSVNLFPNPVNNFMEIKSQGEIITSLKILNVNGKVLLMKSINNFSSVLDLSEIPNGVYGLVIFSN